MTAAPDAVPPFGPSLEGQLLAVVGAASGIGRSAADLLARRGARVACLDRDLAGVQELASKLRAEGLDATAATLDVSDATAVERRLAEVVAGRWLHGLVNCAGITGTTGRTTLEVDIDDFDEVVRVNLRGAFLVSRAALAVMVPQGYGRLLHVASIAGKDGNAGMVAYSASKAGLIGMVKAQGKEFATSGVTVNALAPGVIRTPLVDRMPDEQVAYMTDRIPMRRCGTLDEAAEMVAWILSPAASFTTGFTFDLSGGRATY